MGFDGKMIIGGMIRTHLTRRFANKIFAIANEIYRKGKTFSF